MILTYRLVGKGERELTGHWFTEEEARAYLNRRTHDPLDHYIYVLEGLPAPTLLERIRAWASKRIDNPWWVPYP